MKIDLEKVVNSLKSRGFKSVQLELAKHAFEVVSTSKKPVHFGRLFSYVDGKMSSEEFKDRDKYLGHDKVIRSFLLVDVMKSLGDTGYVQLSAGIYQLPVNLPKM